MINAEFIMQNVSQFNVKETQTPSARIYCSQRLYNCPLIFRSSFKCGQFYFYSYITSRLFAITPTSLIRRRETRSVSGAASYSESLKNLLKGHLCNSQRTISPFYSFLSSSFTARLNCSSANRERQLKRTAPLNRKVLHRPFSFDFPRIFRLSNAIKSTENELV